MERCSESLRDRLNTIPRMATHEVHQLARHMTFALLELNRKKIIHRNIKPENILISRDQFNQVIYKLADFGISKLLRIVNIPLNLSGSTGYEAPEVTFNQYDAIHTHRKM